MLKNPLRLTLCCGIVAGCTALLRLSSPQAQASGSGQAKVPTYDQDGHFVLPPDYREWVFLSAGIDMAYGPGGVATEGHSVFDNVFVNPEAYRSFLAGGTWPDKTVLVLEVRRAETNASINHGGHSQGEVTGLEVHLKDAARFAPEQWAFFDVKPTGVGTLIPRTENCYSCHQEHAAVDTTFVQFYPTLLPVAKNKGTLSPAFLKRDGRSRVNQVECKENTHPGPGISKQEPQPLAWP